MSFEIRRVKRQQTSYLVSQILPSGKSDAIFTVHKTFSGVQSFISQRIQIHLGFCFLFVLFSRGCKTSSISVRNKRKPRPCSKAAVTRAIFLLAMVKRFCQFHGMSLIQTSFIRDHSHKFHLVSSLFVSLSVATCYVLTNPP